ncbi:MAG: hypothetical protein ACE1ZA_03335, partial [Pseudomonadales bacterium]
MIIDDGDSGFSVTTGWSSYGSGYQNDLRFIAQGNGTEVAAWTFNDLTAGAYRVSATWIEHPNRATDASYSVFDGTNLQSTVNLNQELAPNDLSDAGTTWEDLGNFVITGSTLTVSLSNAANEYVIADAIRIVRIGDVPGALSLAIEDSQISENGGSTTGTVTRSGDTTSPLTVTLASSDNSEATVPTSVTIAAGSTQAAFTITGVDDSQSDGNQTVTLTASATNMIAGSSSIEVTDDEAPVLIIDDGDSGFSVTTGWSSHGSGYQNDIRFIARGNGTAVAAWTFNELTAGTYRVSATWIEHPNRATDAPYSVFDATNLQSTVNLNQELAPNDFSDAGTTWEDIGNFAITGSTLTVSLSNAANEYVIADAIRI